MNYMKQIDAWLEEIGITTVETRKAIKDKILESYRNGQEHGKKSGTSGVGKVVGAFAKEAVRQVTYTSPKRKKYTKYTKPRR